MAKDLKEAMRRQPCFMFGYEWLCFQQNGRQIKMIMASCSPHETKFLSPHEGDAAVKVSHIYL